MSYFQTGKSLKGMTYEKGDFEQGKTCKHCKIGTIVRREYSIGDCDFCGQPHQFSLKSRRFKMLKYVTMPIPEIVKTEREIHPRFEKNTIRQ